MRDSKRPQEGSELTPREREILTFVGKGMQNKEIARILGIAIYTVNEHLKVIYIRLGVCTRVEAAVWAAKQGWL